MEYTQELLDRKTGELATISLGDWITLTELGELYGVGRRQVRSVLRAMDFLHVEGASSHQRHRLSNWVVDRGWGRRIERKGTIPFDVIGPDARSWIAERWSATVAALEAAKSAPVLDAQAALDAFRTERNAFRQAHCREEMDVAEQISWLAYHYPKLTQIEIASIVSVTQQLVGRYLAKSSARRQKLRALLNAPLEIKPKTKSNLKGSHSSTG